LFFEVYSPICFMQDSKNDVFSIQTIAGVYDKVMHTIKVKIIFVIDRKRKKMDKKRIT